MHYTTKHENPRKAVKKYFKKTKIYHKNNQDSKLSRFAGREKEKETQIYKRNVLTGIFVKNSQLLLLLLLQQC
jgi:hypothetical protein